MRKITVAFPDKYSVHIYDIAWIITMPRNNEYMTMFHPNKHNDTMFNSNCAWNTKPQKRTTTTVSAGRTNELDAMFTVRSLPFMHLLMAENCTLQNSNVKASKHFTSMMWESDLGH